jgi:hypothetical protein
LTLSAEERVLSDAFTPRAGTRGTRSSHAAARRHQQQISPQDEPVRLRRLTVYDEEYPAWAQQLLALRIRSHSGIDSDMIL